MPSSRLSDLTHADIQQQAYEVAVIPIGACEPHNFHLPYGTDAIEAERIAERICQQATQLGARVIQLPTIPYGVDSNMLDIPLAINVYPSTLFALLRDIIDSLHRHGIGKIVLFNSHGGNDFLKPFIREMTGRLDVFICAVDWWKVGSDGYDAIFTHRDDHAGEMETSIMLALAPELVRMEQASDGAFRPARFEAIRRGWVAISRPWRRLTSSTGVGNPLEATREKGEQYLDLLVPRLAKFIAELSQADRQDEQFPFEGGQQE